MRGLNLDQLQTFADVVRLGSFSAAAQRLNLTQPAVSLQIRQLEQKLGVTLIERTGRRATPTAAGRELLAHAHRIDAAVTAALEDVAQHAKTIGGRVRLGTGATACIYLLPPALSDLRRRFPKLEIVVRTGNTVDIVRAVEENDLDLGLVTLPVPGRSLEVTPLLEDDFVAVGSAAAALPAAMTPALLAERPVVLYEPGAHTRTIIDAWFARAGIALKPAMELGSVEATKQLVAAGLGCSILPAMALTAENRKSKLVVRPLKPRLSRKLGLVMRRDKPLNRALRETVARLRLLAQDRP